MNTNTLCNDLSTAAFALSAHVANGGPHAECHAFTAAWLADQIIFERTREQQELDDAPRLNWYAGDVLEVYAHASEPGKGLSYPAMTVTASEGGFAGGWDVYDATRTDDGSEVSFYGFSVKSAQDGAL